MRGIVEYGNQSAHVVATAEGLRSPRNCNLNPDFYSPDKNGNKIIPPGCFAASIPGKPGQARILPRTYTVGFTPSGQQSITVRHSSPFVAGDNLQVIYPSVVLEFKSTTLWQKGDVISIALGGQTLTATLGDADLEEESIAKSNLKAAGALLRQLSTNDVLRRRISPTVNEGAADSNSAFLTLRSRTGEAYTATVPSQDKIAVANLTAGQVIGKVKSANPDESKIMLEAATTAPIFPGIAIGDPVSGAARFGMLNPLHNIDLRSDNTSQALWISMSVWSERLPYWDDQLAADFPEIKDASKVSQSS